jgi:eukaryotic-like serine/threonine-protein kinase
MLDALLLLLRRFTQRIRSIFPPWRTDPSAELLRLPRGYRRVQPLATGGMGRVFSAEHRKFGRVAIKLATRNSESARALLRREARLTAGLDHPNVVRVHEIGETRDGTPFFTMPLVQGTTLRALVERSGRLAPARVAEVLARICDVLAAAVAKGFVHGDLKPSNVMLGAGGDVTVLDFGLSTPIGTVQRPSFDPGGLIGTPAYLAPEVLRGSGLSERSELYAVGLVGYWLLTGRHAFGSGTAAELEHRHAHAEPVLPSMLTGEPLPDALEDLVLRCLRKLPEDRPPSVVSLAAELRNLQPGLEAEPTLPCSRPPILPPLAFDPGVPSIDATVPDLTVQFDTAVLIVRA